jgi:peptide/nickel transport system substrate-binding protein
MQTGQIDLAIGDQTTLSAAKKAGFASASSTVTNNVTGVTLADRGGVLSKPLSDVRVRQALNYATDRSTIVNALFPGNTATAEMATPGTDGYDPNLQNAYPYDVTKAKDLLTQAGYPSGFTLELTTTKTNSQDLFAQALAQQWQLAGITVKITDIADGNAYVAQALGGKTPAFTNNFAVVPIATEGTSLFLATAAYNPFHYEDAKLQNLYNQDVVSSGSAKAALDKEIVAYLVHQAWFVPVVAQGLPFYATKKITGTEVSQKAQFISLYGVQPAS